MLLTLGWFAVAPIARAEAPREEPYLVALEYRAPAECPTVSGFRSVVARRLGYEPFRDGASERVLVIVASSEKGLEGRLEWVGRTGKWAGEQNFPATERDCGELVRTMGLALAVQIHLLATESEESGSAPVTNEEKPPEPALEAKPKPPAPPPPPPTEPRAAASATSERSKVHAFTGAGASVGFGLAPTVLLLGRLFGGVAWPNVTLELGGALSTRSRTEREDGAGFEQQLLLGSFAACGTYSGLSTCAMVEAGSVRISGRSVDERRSATGAAVLLGLRSDFRLRLGALGFVAPRAAVFGNLNRWTVTLDALSVWRAPPVAVELGLDGGIVFE
jgi:hypothetical protein